MWREILGLVLRRHNHWLVGGVLGVDMLISNKPETGKIYQGDCLEIMRGWPDKCVDLVLSDPPYGEKITKKSNTYGGTTKKWNHPHSRIATGESWDDKPAATEH